MIKLINIWLQFFGLGIGATLLMDLWSVVLRLMGVSTLNYAMPGRWCLHWRIQEAQTVRSEKFLGWTLHYLTGIFFALLFVVIAGHHWIEAPTLLPALIFGVVTVFSRGSYCSLHLELE